ncbi:MAG: ATP-binding cassette domain-containing protein [FCB group bacterium]|jgi:ABC-2 type transport system ATP-binding protein
MDVLQVKNIFKRFGNYEAVSNVSFTVGKGHIFGLLGPNGAGKTTTIRMITNILMPDEGNIYLFEKPVGSLQQNDIGYLPEERGLYKKIKVIDQLIYFGQLKGLTRAKAQSEARSWLLKMDAQGWENKKIQELSKGMQQKIQFISTILHNPSLMILDEPFSGFDPINTELLKKIIYDMKEQGKTIILSTHVMEQAEQLCDNICLIDKGKLVLSGSLRDIKSRYGRDTILIEFEGDAGFLDEFRNLNFINRTDNRAEFRITGSGYTSKEILEKAMQHVEIIKFELVEPSLHEIFIDVVTKQEQRA